MIWDYGWEFFLFWVLKGEGSHGAGIDYCSNLELYGYSSIIIQCIFYCT